MPTSAYQEYKNAHSFVPLCNDLPLGDTVSIELIKSAEIEIQRRRLVTTPPSMATPFWFVCETERNVFLWQNGCSLSEAEQFQFWVDMPALLQKRQQQLNNYSTENPFLNPLWGLPSAGPAASTIEQEYLEELKEALAPVLAHLHALSRVEALMWKELFGRQKPAVVLPGGRNRRKAGSA